MIRHSSEYLTDNYKKDTESGNYKLLSIGHEERLEIAEAINMLEACRDIDNAFGFTLDKAGKNVLELRSGRDDDAFRLAIKTKILNGLSSGTIDELNSICEILLGENFGGLSETWHMKEYGYEPAGIVLTVKNSFGSQPDAYKYINSALEAAKAGGVNISYSLEIDGNETGAGVAVSSAQCIEYENSALLHEYSLTYETDTAVSAGAVTALELVYENTEGHGREDIAVTVRSDVRVDVAASSVQCIEYDNTANGRGHTPEYKVYNNADVKRISVLLT